MQRHGDQRPFLFQCDLKPAIRKRPACKLSKRAGKMDFPSVFQAMHQFQSFIAAIHRSQRELEMKRNFLTVRTIERAIDPAVEALATSPAEWADNAWQLLRARPAERLSIRKTTATQLANRRIQPVKKPLHKTCDHMALQ